WITYQVQWIVEERYHRQVDWRAAWADAFGGDASENFMPMAELLEYHSRVNNPLLGRRHKGDYGPKPELVSYRRPGNDEMVLESIWHNELLDVIEKTLVPMGAMQLALNQDTPLIRLHPIGRYMLGLADDFEYEAAPEG